MKYLTTETPLIQENMYHHCDEAYNMIMTLDDEKKCLYTDEQIVAYYHANLPEHIANVAMYHPILMRHCISTYTHIIDRAISYEIPYETFMENMKLSKIHGRKVQFDMRKSKMEARVIRNINDTNSTNRYIQDSEYMKCNDAIYNHIMDVDLIKSCYEIGHIILM